MVAPTGCHIENSSALSHQVWSKLQLSKLSLPGAVKISLATRSSAGLMHAECRHKIQYLLEHKHCEMFKIGFTTTISLRWTQYVAECRWQSMTILAVSLFKSQIHVYVYLLMNYIAVGGVFDVFKLTWYIPEGVAHSRGGLAHGSCPHQLGEGKIWPTFHA